MNKWLDVSLQEITKINYGKGLPAKKRITGNIPVYGSNGVVGWHNKATVDKPGIILGRKGTVGAVKFSSTPFCPIDTTYFITSEDTELSLDFLFYLLLHLDLSRLVSDVVPGLNRDLAYAEQCSIPEKEEEQRKIAAVLSLVQEAIRQQEQLIAITTELKKATMQKLFTEGTRGEPQKMTEIGLIPESWDVVKLGDICQLKTGTTPSTKRTDYYIGTIPFIKTAEIVNNQITESTTHISQEAVDDYNLTIFPRGTIFMAMYGQGKTRGQVSLLKIEASTSQNTAAIIPNKFIESTYLWQFLLNQYSQLRNMGAKGHISHLNLGYLKSYKIPLVPLEEQKYIVYILEKVDKKILILEQNRRQLQDLFQTLLHQLMTAQIRVDDLDLSALNIELQGGQEDALV